ncbi:SLC13 family permease [Asticcacaulis sp. EMRT-3]|uniref:SLC13 family permease n=1 Tax=Asticcacaulis sp. EMRT-3 TaxID=3040349 RepID=UPI0024AF408B|nr:SLC13 family permease [Asticcacaulis sp. EMRT-3]MDI7773910.1 SLC13 family permease [Asticcacaulis sp. EMRT-3]
MPVPAPLLSALILGGTLILFVSGRLRHDLIALIALFAAVLTGLVKPGQAFAGFGDPAVIAVASVLVVGRTLELSGVAARLARLALPRGGAFSLQLALLMVIAAALSAFMNNIASLVICMPLATELARNHKRPPGAVLMPLSFATILGGMTTLIGTPANMILSSVRHTELGQGFGFFTMTPVGLSVCVAGLAYLALLGWRFLPGRTGTDVPVMPWQVSELQLTEAATISRADIGRILRETTTRLLALLRRNHALAWPADNRLKRTDKLLVLTRSKPEEVAAALPFATRAPAPDPQDITARMVVAHGTGLIGDRYDAIERRSGGTVRLTGMGPRKSIQRQPLDSLTFQTGDQLFLTGPASDIADFAARERLLEIDRSAPAPMEWRGALTALGIFVAAILATVVFNILPALSFLAAAALMAGLGLIKPRETYKAVDWSIIILLAAMIPVGASFETSGAAHIVAEVAARLLTSAPLPLCLACVCTMTLLLSIMLNNVATALIMGPLAIQLAGLLHVAPDALLLAVLIGTSSDFLTPIGHQNNLLVMGPGGYRFADYSRVGALLSMIVVATSACVLSLIYG